jgi:hypothetical protein
MIAANDNQARTYWLDADRIMTGGLLGARFIETEEAHQLAGYLSREALAAHQEGRESVAQVFARQATELLECLNSRKAA